MLFDYRIGIYKDEKELRDKIANRVGLKITERYKDE